MNQWTQSADEIDRREMHSLLAQLRQKLQTILPAGFFNVSPADALVLSMFWRSVRLYDAATILLRSNLPEEAVMLARASFEEALKLRELGDNESDRLGLIVRHALDAITEKRNLLVKKDRSAEGGDPGVVEQLNDEEAKLMQFATTSGITKIPKFLSVKAAIERYGRTPDLGFYEMSHQFVHGSDLAISFGRTRRGEDELLINDRTSDLWFQVGVAAFVSLSLVEATRGAAKVFGWKGAEEVAALQDLLDPLQNRVHDGRKASQ